MITFVSKLPLKDVSCERLHEIIAACHSLEPLVNQPIVNLENGFIIQDDDVLAYHIEEGSKYDYIFQKSTNELYISIDKRGDFYNLLNYLEKGNLLNRDGEFDILSEVHCMRKDTLEDTMYLPILYFSSSSDETIMKECARKLKGMVHVVCGNAKIDSKMKKQYRARYADFAVLHNQDCLRFSKSKKETNEDYINRIYFKIQMYMSNLVYDYPFNMNELHNRVLAKLVTESKKQEDEREKVYYQHTERLNDDKQKLINQIKEKEMEMLRLSNDIENHKAILASIDAYPVLHKGKIKEFYAGEQRDVILNVLKEEKHSPDRTTHEVQLLEEILKENPKVGNRLRMLDDLDILMTNATKIPPIKSQLQKLNITVQKSGDHYKLIFFDDVKYQTHVSCTGKTYSLRAGWREIKEHFF